MFRAEALTSRTYFTTSGKIYQLYFCRFIAALCEDGSDFNSGWHYSRKGLRFCNLSPSAYQIPCHSMASATLRNPAMLAPAWMLPFMPYFSAAEAQAA